MSKLEEWDIMYGDTKPLYIPTKDELDEVEPTKEVEVVKTKEAKPKQEVVVLKKEVLPTEAEALTHDHEMIAQAMLMTRGDLAKASRLDSVEHNAMSLRAEVKAYPAIRARYHELLADELQEKGLHIAERILRMAELQEKAMGQTVMVEGPDGMEEMDLPADPKMVIELSKEISRLIAEGKTQNMSAKSTVILASKEDAVEILAAYLNS